VEKKKSRQGIEEKPKVGNLMLCRAPSKIGFCPTLVMYIASDRCAGRSHIPCSTPVPCARSRADAEDSLLAYRPKHFRI
jgi:hypothetical protein